MRKLLRSAVGIVAGLSLLTGVAAAQTGSISNTGPGSHNSVEASSKVHQTTTNNNNVGVSNTNDQTASSGDAKVKWNTTGGDASTGTASNSNGLAAMLTVDNTGSCGCLSGDLGMGDPSGTISTTGPGSNNEVEFHNSVTSTVTNNNSISLSNSNSQTATSGNASVSGNTTGGSASTGDATNTNNTSITLSVSN